MTAIPPLPRLLIEPAVRRALTEDLGRAGDITSQACIAEGTMARAAVIAREPGVVAGLDMARLAFELINPALAIEVGAGDGMTVTAGETIMTIAGSARAILTAERVALNFAGHLSGVATATARLVEAVAGTKARIVCTRKTTPGLRAFEKHAVRLGGGANHRFGLDDAILIKDNHIAASGGITEAVSRARSAIGHMVKIEVECDTLDQVAEALAAEVEIIMLDNMSPTQIAEAVAEVGDQALTEASGGITMDSVRAIAEAGVDMISSGAITHSAPSLDLGLDFER